MSTNTVTPTYSEKDVLEALHHCSKVSDSLTAKRALKKAGYDFAAEVPPSRRWLVISMLNLEAKRYAQANEKPKDRTGRINMNISVEPVDAILGLGAVRRAVRLLTPKQYTRTLRRGPVSTTKGKFTFGATVTLMNGRTGKVASVTANSPTHVERLVLVMDDCSTVVLDHVDVVLVVKSITHDGGYVEPSYKPVSPVLQPGEAVFITRPPYTPPRRNPTAPPHHQV